ncbi:MAG: hypothetical protein J0H68_09720 [Sphingobacteriia bacterium]|nr:hypothetical protein [Sphingobacteriia bacterium]
MKETTIKSFELYLLENNIELRVKDKDLFEYTFKINKKNILALGLLQRLSINNFFEEITDNTFKISDNIIEILPLSFITIEQYEKELRQNLIDNYIANLDTHYNNTLEARRSLYSKEQSINEDFLNQSRIILEVIYSDIEIEDILPPIFTWIDHEVSTKKYNNFSKIIKYAPFLKNMGGYSNYLENYVDAAPHLHSSEVSLVLPLNTKKLSIFLRNNPEYNEVLSPFTTNTFVHRYELSNKKNLFITEKQELVRIKDKNSLIQFHDNKEDYKTFIIGSLTVSFIGTAVLATPNIAYKVFLDKVIPVQLGLGFLASKTLKPATEFLHGNLNDVLDLLNDNINLEILTDPNWANEIKLSKFLRRNFNAEFAILHVEEICIQVPQKCSIPLQKVISSINNLCIIEQKYLIGSFKTQFKIKINDLNKLILNLTSLYLSKEVLCNNFKYSEKEEFKIDENLQIRNVGQELSNKLIIQVIQTVGTINYANSYEKRIELEKIENLVLLTKGTILKLLKLEQSNSTSKTIHIPKAEIKKNYSYIQQLIDKSIIQLMYNKELELYEISIINFKNVKQILTGISFLSNTLESNIRNEIFLEFEGITTNTPSPTRNYLCIRNNGNIQNTHTLENTIISLKDLKKTFVENSMIRNFIIKKHFNEFDFHIFLLSMKNKVLTSLSSLIPPFANTILKLEIQKREDIRNNKFSNLLNNQDFAFLFVNELKKVGSKTSNFFFTNVRAFSVKCILKVLNLLIKESYIDETKIDFDKENYEKELDNLNTLAVSSNSIEKRDRVTTCILPLGSQTYKGDNIKSYSDLEKLNDSQYSYNYLKRYAMNQIFRFTTENNDLRKRVLSDISKD